jgi:hypothetical protein
LFKATFQEKGFFKTKVLSNHNFNQKREKNTRLFHQKNYLCMCSGILVFTGAVLLPFFVFPLLVVHQYSIGIVQV